MNICKHRRLTLESDVELKMNIFGNSFFKIKTFNFFFDHLFIQFVNYSNFDCFLRCYSDLKSDSHHMIEDIGISVGFLLKNFLFNRYNNYFISMDETLILINMEICNRYYYYDNILFNDYDFMLIKEFFISFSKKFKCNINIIIFKFLNKHHLLESIFKLFGILFYNAKYKVNKQISTKGFI